MSGNTRRRTPPRLLRGDRVIISLKPGDKLPEGTYVQGWKLDATIYGPNVLYLIYEPKEE